MADIERQAEMRMIHRFTELAKLIHRFEQHARFRFKCQADVAIDCVVAELSATCDQP